MKQKEIGQNKEKGPKVVDEVENILKKYISIGIWPMRLGEFCIFVIGIIFPTLGAMDGLYDVVFGLLLHAAQNHCNEVGDVV